MRCIKLLLAGLLLVLSTTPAWATGSLTPAAGAGGTVAVQENDGSPSVVGVTTFKVTNGSLTDNGDGSVTIATSGASNVTIDSSAVTGGTAASLLYVGAGPVLKQVSIDALVVGNGATVASAYAGTSCTNQVLRVLGTKGAGTCVTLTSAYVDTSIWTGTVSSGLLKASSQGVVAQATPGTDYTKSTLGTANEITATNSSGDVTISLPATVNFSSKVRRIPNGSSLPGTCTLGDEFMSTSATSGQKHFLCESTNTWVVQGDGGGGGSIGGSTGATDNAILRADGTGGATLQSSSCSINDSGALTCTGGITAGTSGTGTLTLLEGTAPGAGTNAGEHNVYFDSSDSKLKSHENGGSVQTYPRTSDNLGIFAATSSAQLSGVLNDETGSGLAVFGTTPTLTTPVISGAISFPDGVTQTFNPNGTNAGLNVGSQAGALGSPNNGDIYYDSTANKYKCRENGVTVDCISTGAGSGDLTDVVAGTGIAVATPGGPAPTVSWSPATQVASFTLFDSANATRTETIGLSGATDPVWTYGNNSADLSAGVLKQGGVAVATDSSTNTFTNKTLDAEGTGNVITVPRRIWLPAAGCNNATAGSIWDLPTTNAAVAACVTGTNTQKGVLDFADSSNLSAQITWKLPSTWTGAVDLNVKWFTSATTGDVVWQSQTICTADAETDDPSFNTADAFAADTAKGTTLQTNDASDTGITMTGCAAGELLHLKIFRDSAHASDTLAATARLIGVELVLREAL